MKTIWRILVFMFSTNLVMAATVLNPSTSFDVGFSPRGNSLNLVLNAINSAKTSINVASYSFTSKPIAQALYQAYLRGVKVYVVADLKANSGHYSAVHYLANHNVPVRLDGNYPIFHHKFMIIDDKTLETGSFNYSAAAANKNAENVLILWNVPQIAKVYKEQWVSLWNEAQTLTKDY